MAEPARRGVVCAGCILVDVNTTIDHYPARERLALIETAVPGTGGPALNMAVDLVRLGLPGPVRLVGAIGDDAHGRFVLQTCAGLGIDTGGVAVLPGAVTSYTEVMIEKDGGRRTFFHHIGANGLLEPGMVDLGPGSAGSTAKILHLGAPGLHPALDRAGPGGEAVRNGFVQILAAARAAGLRTNLELVTLPPEQIRAAAVPCLPYLDYLVVNELEAAALTGLGSEVPGPDGPVDWPGLEASAARLIELGVGRLAVIHFPAGCVAAAANGATWRLGSVRVPPAEVRSTVGAGDAFAAGVLLGLHEDRPVPECLRLGACAAAVSLAGQSTSDSLLPAEACLAYGRRHGYRPA